MFKKLLSKNKSETSNCSITYGIDIDQKPQIGISISPGREADFIRLLCALHSGQLIDLTKAYIDMVGSESHMSTIADLVNRSFEDMLAQNVYTDVNIEYEEDPLICPTDVFMKHEPSE